MVEALIILIIVGVALWLVNQYVPMAPAFKTVVNVIAVLFLVLWLLRLFGVISGGPHL